jgi:hypothetical protein
MFPFTFPLLFQIVSCFVVAHIAKLYNIVKRFSTELVVG